jgi:ankyrin repeat protein
MKCKELYRFCLILLLFGAFLVPQTAFAGAYDDMLNAVKTKDIGKVNNLLQRGMDVNTTDPAGNSLLMLAAQNGDSQILELLLNNKANVLSINKYGDSALMLASLNGHLQSAIALVAAGAEIDPEGWTPLIYAAFEGHTELVRFLLTLDIDIDAQSENGMTALMAAIRNGHLDVVKVLLEQDPDINLVNQNNLTALGIAQGAGNEGIIVELLKAVRRQLPMR